MSGFYLLVLFYVNFKHFQLLAKINEFYNVDLLSKYDLTVQPFGSANKEYSIPSQLSASGHHG